MNRGIVDLNPTIGCVCSARTDAEHGRGVVRRNSNNKIIKLLPFVICVTHIARRTFMIALDEFRDDLHPNSRAESMSIRRTKMLRAVTMCALTVTACSEQSPIAPTRSVTSSAMGTTSGPNDALLPLGSILSVAAQLIATSGTSAFVVDAMQSANTTVPFLGFWADPLAGKGWIQTGALDAGHFYLVPFTWNSRDTSVAGLASVINHALAAAASGTGPRTNIDGFTRDQIGQLITPKLPTSMTAIEALIDQAETTEFDMAIMSGTQQRVDVIAQPGSLISDPALFGHSVRLSEFWFAVKRTSLTTASSVKGSYAITIDGRASVHQFSATALNVGAQPGSASIYYNLLSDQIIADARKALGLPTP
jgi:hypothetical protein